MNPGELAAALARELGVEALIGPTARWMLRNGSLTILLHDQVAFTHDNEGWHFLEYHDPEFLPKLKSALGLA